MQDLYNTNKNSMETVTSNSEPTLRTALNQITDTDLSTYKHYVSENCYSYNLTNDDLISGSGTTYPFVNDQFKTAFSADVIAERFAEVLKDIENENLYRETDGGRAPLDKTISEATVLRYIINFNYKRTQVKKDKLYVLELQPCASWDLSYVNKAGSAKENGILYYKEDVPAQKRELINQKGTEIILTHMTTAEFIGKNEDINATYDMIYIGLNTGLMNTTSGKTDYNDDTMDGMVYTNVGDYIHAEPSLGGMLNIDYINEDRGKELKGRTYYKASNRIGRYRYSGNDITEEKQRALQDFISAGYPIIVESDMILVDQTTEKRQPNEAVLDNSSNMYALIKNMTGNNSPNHQADKKNLIRLDDMTGDLFNWYLNLSKPVISMTEGTKAAESMLNTRTLSRAADGYYYLQYQFTLSNVGAADINTACDCKLYIDVNADGKFSKTKEQEKDIIITDETGNLQHPDEHGDYSLATGKEYYVKRALSKEYVGVLPWKIEVTQRGNSSRRAGVMGYFEINHDKKEVINILQIKTSTLTGNVNNIDLGAAMENEKSMFYHYIETLNDFEVKVTSMTSAEYKVKHDEYYPSGSYMANAGSEYLNQYDMLILGFSDVYQEADNSTGAMTAIRDYIAAGHSILFTHDTSSISNVPNNQFYANEEGGARRYLSYGDWWDTTYTKVANFGYSFNTLIRGLVGMDRYGILGPNQDILRRGDIVSNTSAEEWNKLTDKSKNGRKDIAYVPGSNRTKTTSEVQGYTYLWLNWLREDKTGTFANYKDIDGNMGQYNNQTITQVNSGQITTYPYKIAKTFKVAPTHAQYYQLDLESDEDQDGESDIVVWYTINDDNTENETLNNEKDIYKFSPGDVRNNYYIFNKGNITYSGVGHSSEEKKYFEGDYSDDVDANEVKLFINTMIAAYRAGLHAPKVTILDNKEYYSREIKNLYIGYDKQYAANQIEDGEIRRDGLLDVAENVFFTADQVNLVEGDQVLAVRYYYESDDADAISLTMSRNEEPVKVKELTAACPLYRASDETAAAEYVIDGHKVYILEASKVYRLAVPTTILPSGKNAVKIYVEVTAIRENKKTGKYEMVPGYGEVSLVRTQMFNLE